jgi:Ca-activated chloride channel family protein
MAPHVLGLSLALDERGLPTGTATRAHLVAEVSATAAGIERARPPLSVALAVDVSGSMAGPPIEQVIASIDRVTALLEPTDRIGVVAFSDSATEVTPLLPADATARRLIAQRTRRLVAEGGTNVERGLALAAKLLPARGAHERQVILLLSDGAPNRGKSTAAELAELAKSFRPDVSVSTLGYGPQHNEDLLAAIAEGGAGRYQFIADPAVCELELAQAIGAQGDVVAEAIALTLQLEPGVEVVRFLGKPAVRFGAQGLRLDVPDLLEGSRHLVVAELSLATPREPGPWKVARAVLGYQRAGQREALAVEEDLVTVIGREGCEPVPEARARVLLMRADEVRAEARALADRGQYDGAAAVLRRLMAAITEETWFKSGDGSPLDEALEQLLDEAVALERKPSVEEYTILRKSQLAGSMMEETLAPLASPLSVMAMGSVGGALPRAALVAITGEAPGRRFPLALGKAVIGRGANAEIRVQDGSVSRRHAVVAGQNGRFIVVDMGSTNTTQVNGEPVAKPHPLAPGDVIRVGDIELRYEEEPPK